MKIFGKWDIVTQMTGMTRTCVNPRDLDMNKLIVNKGEILKFILNKTKYFRFRLYDEVKQRELYRSETDLSHGTFLPLTALSEPKR